jgi:hypothetical protein
MNSHCLRRAALVALVISPLSFAAELTATTPLGEPAGKIYRQVMPDGRIVYSDEPIKGARIDDTITPDPAVEGKLWKAEGGKRPTVPPRTERTPISRVPPPASDGRRSLDDANTDVIRAEMLLEDARKRQEAGVEPLPGERTGLVSGKSRLNEHYNERQRALAEDVAEAEAMLKKAQSSRRGLSAY